MESRRPLPRAWSIARRLEARGWRLVAAEAVRTWPFGDGWEASAFVTLSFDERLWGRTVFGIYFLPSATRPAGPEAELLRSERFCALRAKLGRRYRFDRAGFCLMRLARLASANDAIEGLAQIGRAFGAANRFRAARGSELPWAILESVLADPAWLLRRPDLAYAGATLTLDERHLEATLVGRSAPPGYRRIERGLFTVQRPLSLRAALEEAAMLERRTRRPRR